MLNSKQYRVKVAEYKERGKKTDAPNEIREIKNLGRTFTEMADIFGRSDNAVIRLRVLRVSQAPGSSMSACHGKHRAVDLLARSRDHSGRPDGGSEQRHESCELSRRGCSKMPTLRFRDQEIAKYRTEIIAFCSVFLKIAKIAKPTIEISDKVQSGKIRLEQSKKIAKEKSENSDDMPTLLRPRSRMLLKGDEGGLGGVITPS
jgi:hypothetical protein